MLDLFIESQWAASCPNGYCRVLNLVEAKQNSASGQDLKNVWQLGDAYLIWRLI
jgi:hypothetical protein